MTKIIVTNVTKIIKKQAVLSEVNLQFEEGMIYGLHGKNGSGKTMLLRAIAGLLRPTSGTVEIDGVNIYKDNAFPPSIGVIIENTSLLPQYNAFTNLKLLAKIKNIATDDDINEAIKRVGLETEKVRKVKKYSLGMKQRLSIAQAIFEKPEILLLDELTNAIDEDGVQDIYDIMKQEKERGATIIIASHHKQDLEVMADKYIRLKEGRVMLE